MPVAAGLLLRLCTQLLRLVRLRAGLGLPQILVVGDSRPVNLNDPPRKAQPRASGALLWPLTDSTKRPPRGACKPTPAAGVSTAHAAASKPRASSSAAIRLRAWNMRVFTVFRGAPMISATSAIDFS